MDATTNNVERQRAALTEALVKRATEVLAEVQREMMRRPNDPTLKPIAQRLTEHIERHSPARPPAEVARPAGVPNLRLVRAPRVNLARARAPRPTAAARTTPRPVTSTSGIRVTRMDSASSGGGGGDGDGPEPPPDPYAIDRWQFVCHGGFQPHRDLDHVRCMDAGRHLPPNEVEVARCAEWLARFAKPTKTIRTTRGAHRYKHLVEASGSGYVSTGAFVVAALRAGYRVRRRRHGSFDAHLNLTVSRDVLRGGRR